MDYMELNALKTFFPQCDVGPNCYSTSKNYSKFKENLCLSSSCKIIKASPNRRNVFLDVSRRLSNNVGYKSHEDILLPIVKNLNKLRECYPMTIIYMK